MICNSVEINASPPKIVSKRVWFLSEFLTFPDVITPELEFSRTCDFFKRWTTIRTTSYQKTIKIVWVVFERLVKNLEKRPFLTLFGQYVRNSVRNQKSGSVSQIVPFFRDFVQNLKNIHIVEHTELADDTHTHGLTLFRIIAQIKIWEILCFTMI